MELLKEDGCIGEKAFHGEKECFFQPFYNVEKKRIWGAEALFRLKDENGNYYNMDQLAAKAENECDISFIDLNKYQSYKKNQIEFCGTEIFDSQKLLSQIDSMNFEEFAKNRHSVRDFAVGTVDESIIRKAVELAQTAPSACNRQSTRVHYIQNRDICKNVLDLQGGAKGHTVSSVIVLTSELSLYRHTSEFKTPYLDSGIYLMNLLYALTYYGIGTCPLIWNDDGEKAEEIRRFVDIPWSEQIVAIIQVGHYATNECKYAASNRRAVFDVLKIH